MEETRGEVLSDLHYKLLITFVILLFLSVIVYYYASIQYQNVLSIRQRYVHEVVNSIESHTQGQLMALKVTANNYPFKTLPPDELLPHLNNINNILNLKASSIYEVSGRRIASTSPRLTYNDLNHSESFHKTINGYNTISNRIDFWGIDEAYISYRVPLYDINKQIIGVMTAEESINTIKQVIEKIFPPERRQYIYVVDNNGNFIYHPRLNDIYPEGDKYTQRLCDFFLNQKGIIVAPAILDDCDMLYVFSTISNSRWRVIMATDVTGLYLEILRQSRYDIVIFLLLLVTIGLLLRSFYLSKKHDIELQNEKLQRLISVSQLAAGLAHEIKNPLTAIKGFLQLIGRKKGQPIPENYFEVMMSEISRIEKLINEFRLLAKPNKETCYSKVNFTAVIQDVVLLMESQAVNKNTVIESYLSEPAYVLGEEQRLKQVVINLIKNAIEAVQEQGKVIVKLESDDNNVMLHIIDNGIGIDENVLKRIGSPFFTTKRNGTGLGLSVCYSIIEHHNGNIQVHSQLGKGTEFIVTLPKA